MAGLMWYFTKTLKTTKDEILLWKYTHKGNQIWPLSLIFNLSNEQDLHQHHTDIAKWEVPLWHYYFIFLSLPAPLHTWTLHDPWTSLTLCIWGTSCRFSPLLITFHTKIILSPKLVCLVFISKIHFLSVKYFLFLTFCVEFVIPFLPLIVIFFLSLFLLSKTFRSLTEWLCYLFCVVLHTFLYIL